MENAWVKGARVLLIASDNNEDILDVKYVERNYFEDFVTGSRFYFNEALFPYAEEGIVVYLDTQASHVLKPYEVLTIN